MKSLTVVMSTHNRLAYTKRTIESLFETVPNATFIIYDDGSTEEGMKDYLRSLQVSPFKVLIILSDSNIGWGAARNTALSHAYITKEQSDYILVTDNDVIYEKGWFEKLAVLYEKYPQIGVLAVWKHVNHGVLEDKGDLIIKDQMPGCGWLLKRGLIEKVEGFPEHGPCHTKGGNGEDVTFCNKVRIAGFWICAPKDDVAQHIDGY